MPDSNPFATLQQISTTYILSRCQHVVADPEVADVLDETPRTAAELAAPVGARPGTRTSLAGHRRLYAEHAGCAV